MSPSVADRLNNNLKHLYINPLEKCNLACKICYTRKTSPILTAEQILAFINRYREMQTLQTVTFCGGEVMALDYFPGLVNQLTAMGIFVRIITNGTINKLAEFTDPNSINIIVSLDGLPAYHDSNRGTGNFAASLEYLKEAQLIGFHTEVFSIVTKQNLPQITAFEKYLAVNLHRPVDITYHPRKPMEYLKLHPVSNIAGTTSGFDFLEPQEMKELMETKNTFPSKNLGCYQIALTANGQVYGCCEGAVPIGTINDDILLLISRLRQRVEEGEAENSPIGCLGCSQKEFVCGIRELI